MSFLARRLFGTSSSAMESAKAKAQQLIDDNAVIVFSKTWCSYSRNSKRILDSLNAKYEHYELDIEQDGEEIQAALAEMTGQHTVPNIFIGKKHIGGNSDLQSHQNRDLVELLKNAGAIA